MYPRVAGEGLAHEGGCTFEVWATAGLRSVKVALLVIGAGCRAVRLKVGPHRNANDAPPVRLRRVETLDGRGLAKLLGPVGFTRWNNIRYADYTPVAL